MQLDLAEVTIGLVQDLSDLRSGKISNADGRVRAQLAREIMRSVSLQLEGMRVIEAEQAKRITGESSE